MTEKIKRVATSEIFAATLALLFASPILYWSFDRADPVALHRWEIEPKVARRGETIYRVVEVTRRKACPSDPVIMLIDGEGTRWIMDEPVVPRPGPTGERHYYKAPITIPSAAGAGPAAIYVTIRRECNPLQKFWPQVTHYPPLKFYISQ